MSLKCFKDLLCAFGGGSVNGTVTRCTVSDAPTVPQASALRTDSLHPQPRWFRSAPHRSDCFYSTCPKCSSFLFHESPWLLELQIFDHVCGSAGETNIVITGPGVWGGFWPIERPALAGGVLCVLAGSCLFPAVSAPGGCHGSSSAVGRRGSTGGRGPGGMNGLWLSVRSGRWGCVCSSGRVQTCPELENGDSRLTRPHPAHRGICRSFTCWWETADCCLGQGAHRGCLQGSWGHRGREVPPGVLGTVQRDPGLPAACVPATSGRRGECAPWAARPRRERRWQGSRGQGCPLLSCLEGGRGMRHTACAIAQVDYLS